VCEHIRISGSDHQQNKEGEYRLLDDSKFCNGYVSYKQAGGQYYIFHWNDGWFVASSWCDEKVRANDTMVRLTTAYPEPTSHA